VRVPADALLGPRAGAFKVMQARMGVARIMLAMRALGQVRQALDMICERAVSRETQGSTLAEKQLVQSMIAESWMELTQFRLLVLQTAWKLERLGNSKAMRADIAAVKSLTARLIKNVALRGVQIHGSIGVSAEMPFMDMLSDGLTIGIADGPTEVHDVTLARDILKGYQPVQGLFPTRHTLTRTRAAEEKYADALAKVLAERT
jgi:acyl-CoA dehydrogenase